MQLLKLVLENCVFTFQDKFFKQLHGTAMGSPCSPVVANIYMEYFENPCIGSQATCTSQGLEKVCGWCFQQHTQRQPRQNAPIFKFHWPSYKIHHWATKWGGGIPFLDTFPKPQGEGIAVSVYRTPTHTDRYLDFNSSHPILAKRAVVRALMDRAENVCSDPDILAKEMEHLNRVLCYNNYPQWLINKRGKSDKEDPLIHPETGFEIKKHFLHLSSLLPGSKWILEENL